jgi:excisionase family DNA binding protein
MFYEDRLMSSKEAAEYLGMSLYWVQTHRVSEALPAIKVSARRYKYRKSELAEWVEKRRVNPASGSRTSNAPKSQKRKIDLFGNLN